MFSIQHMVLDGATFFEKPVGTWYNPGQVCHLLTRLNKIPDLGGVVFMDRVIYLDQIYTAAGSELGSDIPWTRGVLILIPLMLGLKSINEEYYCTLKALLSFSSTVGVMGGKPKSALYLVGY